MGQDISQLKGSASALNNKNIQTMSNFSPGYILKLKQRFEQGSEDFTLTKDGLKSFFKCSDRECEVLFEMFDTDGNGSIDHYEFVCALSLISHATLDEKAELIFNLYDFDRSQSISKEELTVLMANTLAALKSMEGKKPPSIQEIEQKTNEFFKDSDLNCDNMISLKEFKSYIKKDKQILEVLVSFGVAKSEDLGTDFGAGEEVPDVDSDLDEECHPKGLLHDDKHNGVKDGIDFKPPGEFDEEAQEGDQFMAVKPWIGVIKNSVPTGYKPSRRDGAAPDASIDLEYVYGYRCHDVRNNLRYAADGKLVYHSAGVGIVLDTYKNTQQFYMSHNDDIHCLALDPTGTIVATGQIGPKPFLCVWNCKTMQELHLISSPLIKGIKHVAFSKDGKLLAASDMSDDHNVAIFDLSAKKVAGKPLAPIAFGKGTRALIMSLGFNQAGDTLVATCVKEVNFFTWAGGLLKAQKGTGWGTVPADTILCQTCVGPTLFTGTFSGELISWNGRGISKRQKAHEGKITCLWTRDSGTELISGGADGLLQIWQVNGGALTKMKSYDLKMPEIMSMTPQPTSVCSNQNSKILVGTRGGEIVEFNEQTGAPKLLMRGHFDLELWGLATHPTRPEIFTFGRDAMLGVWDLKTRRQTKHCKLQCGGDVVAFSNAGDLIVLGFLNGTFMVLNNNFDAITKRCDKREGKAIQCIKFNPTDTVCAVGAHDGLIFTYDVKQKFKPMKKLAGHHSTITHIDFSLDGAFLMSNCTSYEILFFDVSTGKQMTSGASMLKDETWDSWTCTLGWPVQGIFPPCSDGTDVNACARSPDGTVLATGDDFGLVKLFSYPCPIEKAAFKKSNGHSSHVTNIVFTKNTTGQSYLVSTGGEDKSIFQWKFSQDSQAKQESLCAAQVEIQQEEQEPVAKDEGGLFEEEDAGEGDQKLCVDPFLGQVKASTPPGFKLQPYMSIQPNANLTLKFAHGFRSFDTRGNLKYTTSGHVVFTTAGLGVVMDINNRTQEFSNLHKEDVVSMALHPNGDIVATGCMAGKELNEASTQKINQGAAGGRQALKEGKLVDIYVWRASTREVLARISGFHRRAVRQLKFSPSGNKLLSIGEDDHHSVAIYDWASQRLLANDKVDPDPVHSACWKNENEFSTCGVKHMKIYTQNGQNLNGKKGAYLTKLPGNNIMMTAVSYVLNGELVSGVSDGSLIRWQGTTCGNPIKAHSDAIWAIERGVDNTFWTGGNDGKVISWNAQFVASKTINIAQSVKLWPGIRSIDVSRDGSKLLIGTRGSDVIEIKTQTGELLNTIIQGHCKAPGTEPAEVWGCATHPTQPLFASAGADRTVRVWNANQMVLCSEQFVFDPTALDWSSDGKYIALGDRNGSAKVLDANTLQVLGTANATNAGKKAAWVEDIKFSPDCQMIAFGTHGGVSKLELVKVQQGGKLQKIASINACISSALTHLDWTLDSSVVVLNSQASELYWIDVNSKKPVNASSTVGFDYATWSCTFGFPVQGIWPGVDYSDVNAVARSRNGELLATGDDFGNVKIFKYPCVAPKAESKSYSGHSSHVTKVKFSAEDSMLITTGGGDLTVLVWQTDLAMNDPVQPMLESTNEQAFSNDDPTYESKEDKSKAQKIALKEERKQTLRAKPAETKEGKASMFDEEQDVVGDEFMAIKPWIGAIKAPSDFRKPIKNHNQAPPVQIELEWVHGYRGSNGRNNLKYMKNGSLTYYAAGVGVTYDPVVHTQKFFSLHTDDITCIAFSSNGVNVATAENGKRPICYIWDADTMMQKLKLVGNGIVRSIQTIAYSPNGGRLVVIDQSDDHNIAVYDTNTGTCIAKSKGDRGAIRDCAWKDEETFVTSGPNHFKQWTIYAAGFTSKMGNFGTADTRHVGCVFNGQTCLTGSMLGQLFLWNGTTLGANPKKLHERIIDAILVTPTHIFTGARDSKINILDPKNYATIFTIDCTTLPDSVCSWVRAITINNAKDTLIVGTFGHEIYEIPVNLQTQTQAGPATAKISGHYAPKNKDNNEAWGLTVFSNKEQYVTVSDDGTMRVWDLKQRKQVKVISLNIDEKGAQIPPNPTTLELADAAQGRSCDVTPKGDFIAIGMRDGSLRIYQTSTWKMTYKKKISNEWFEDMKFSPNGEFLAVGSHDNSIYVFSMPTMALHKKLGKSSSYITHLDWSVDSAAIRTNDGSYELLFYEVQSGKQVTSGASNYCNEPWATNSCVLTWGTQGIWQSGQDGSDINHCDRSHKPVIDGMQLIATADDLGKVSVFRYPSIQENSKSIKGVGHSSHVTKVRWNASDTHILSTGGNDTTVMQWKLKQ